MRIEQVHNTERRVEPVDRQNRRDQRRKDEERSERENQEEAYILNLTRGQVGERSPFLSGAYTSMGAITRDEIKTPPEAAPKDKSTYEGGKPTSGGNVDTYS
ncbi:MAG: hypothetical protein HKN29_04320 [Rhodothermales bacterium]|nr:hypothetical protein [Rhodothermales bacterium]